MKGWHWLDNNGLLWDGTEPPPDGEWLIHDGDLYMCREGLHYSKRLIDALQYAPGNVLCRVECRGEQEHQDDKSVCTQRRILWRVTVPDEVLRRFARRCALDVVHLPWLRPMLSPWPAAYTRFNRRLTSMVMAEARRQGVQR